MQCVQQRWRSACTRFGTVMAFSLRPLSRSNAAQALYEITDTAAGMSGIFLAQRSPLRTVATLFVLLCIATLLGGDVSSDTREALLVFGLASLARHAFLFASFGPRGIAPRLRDRYGSERGFERHEAAAVTLQSLQRVAFINVLLAPSSVSLRLSGEANTAAVALGVLLFGVGVIMSVSATRQTGLDAYYHRALFRGPRHVSLESENLYRLSGNPVYSWGQLVAYGAALLALSPEGMVAAAANQVLHHVFNWRVERRHLNEATRIALEQQLRESLARTSLEPPSSPRRRPPPSRRRSVPPPVRRSVPPPSPRVRAAAPTPAAPIEITPAPMEIDMDVAPDSKAA
jgi:protein-S-isoprenylcysteine O-methyltransferase Ste14